MWYCVRKTAHVCNERDETKNTLHLILVDATPVYKPLFHPQCTQISPTSMHCAPPPPLLTPPHPTFPLTLPRFNPPGWLGFKNSSCLLPTPPPPPPHTHTHPVDLSQYEAHNTSPLSRSVFHMRAFTQTHISMNSTILCHKCLLYCSKHWHF